MSRPYDGLPRPYSGPSRPYLGQGRFVGWVGCEAL